MFIQNYYEFDCTFVGLLMTTSIKINIELTKLLWNNNANSNIF
jgi:hypothetical protein